MRAVYNNKDSNENFGGNFEFVLWELLYFVLLVTVSELLVVLNSLTLLNSFLDVSPQFDHNSPLAQSPRFDHSAPLA